MLQSLRFGCKQAVRGITSEFLRAAGTGLESGPGDLRCSVSKLHRLEASYEGSGGKVARVRKDKHQRSHDLGRA